LDTRFTQLEDWLINDLGYTLNKLEPASADASFRRYFRASTNQGTFVVMDAPPEKESTREFVQAAKDLAQCGVHTPHLYHCDQTNGFIVLEDLGSRTYLDELNDNSAQLYSEAIDALIKLQKGTNVLTDSTWPAYDSNKLTQEMDLFEDWYLRRHLSTTMNSDQTSTWHAIKSTLIATCVEQPQTLVHRDYHSRNLMVTETNSPGVIDFQDMVVGPIAYDLASIFKDCYIRWPREQQMDWLKEYHQKSNSEFGFEQLVRWFDFTGLQRHLKVLGIFCRLHYRDGKQQYMDDLPMVTDYVNEVVDLYDEFVFFKKHFSEFLKRSN